VLYAYGYFVLEAGDPPARLATWDGAAWSVLGGIPDWSSIRAMALHDGELYLGGEGHDSLGALAVLRGGQWVDVPLPLGDRVHSIASIDGRLVVARYAAGLERDAVIELVDGQWRPLRGLEAVHGFSVQEIDGRIVAGGLGLADRGRPGNGVMEYRDGGWRVLGTGGVPSSALHLGAAGDDLLVACAGLVADVGAVNLLTRFDGERFHPVAEDEPTLEGYGRVYTTLAEDDAIYFGGRFSSEDDRLSTCVSMIEDGLWKPMARGLNSDVHKILRYRGEVLAIGGFTSSYDEPVSVVARWTGEAWEQFGDGQLSGTATDAIVFDDRLVVCGPFGVVYWDEQAGSWSAMGDGRSVHLRQWFKMAAHDGELYVLGSSPGWFDNRVVRLNGERWEYFTDPIDGERGSLAWYDGRLYVGHWGVSSSGLSRWEGDPWLEFGDRFLSSPGDVRDMRVVDGELWIAGSFVGMDDVVSPNLIRLRCGCGVDLDGDGVLTLFDYFAFLNAFEARDPSADLDGDGEFTLLDFGAFQDAFDAGCP
jgi:hypothetical protein